MIDHTKLTKTKRLNRKQKLAHKQSLCFIMKISNLTILFALTFFASTCSANEGLRGTASNTRQLDNDWDDEEDNDRYDEDEDEVNGNILPANVVPGNFDALDIDEDELGSIPAGAVLTGCGGSACAMYGLPQGWTASNPNGASPSGGSTVTTARPNSVTVTSSTTAGTPPAASALTASTMPNIVTVAGADPRFSILTGMIFRAGLIDTLNGVGPFTVFAPTNDAFAGVNLAMPKATLKKVLENHVVPGVVLASDLTDGGSAKAVGGGTLTFTMDELMGTWDVNEADILQANIMASNGVIHVIDEILMP